MNYVELNLGDKKRGAKLGIGFLRYVTTEKKITLDEFFKLLESPGTQALFILPELIFFSLAYNCKRAKKEIDFDLDDVFEWIDEDGGAKSDVLAFFVKSLHESLGTDLGKTEPQAKEAKKK